MGMNQAVDGRGFDAGTMANGYAPRGDPAAAYAAMMQAQTAPAQFPAMQMPFGAPAASVGWQSMTINPMTMNRGMLPNDGAVATGGPGRQRWRRNRSRTRNRRCSQQLSSLCSRRWLARAALLEKWRTRASARVRVWAKREGERHHRHVHQLRLRGSRCACGRVEMAARVHGRGGNRACGA